jgi:hypothetical protein
MRRIVARRLLGLMFVGQGLAMGAAAAQAAAPAPALAARLQRVADQQDIERLIADYSAFLAAKDFDSYGKLFAHGAFLGPQGQVIASGSEQVAALVRKYLGGNSDTTVRHLVTNTRIDIAPDGNSAQAESFLTTIQAKASQPAQIFRIAIYKDRFKKVAGAWVFASRQEETAWVLKERQAAGTPAPPAEPANGKPAPQPNNK